MGPVTKGFVRGVSAATEENRLFSLEDASVGAFDPEWTSYFKGPSGIYFENGPVILHYGGFNP